MNRTRSKQSEIKCLRVPTQIRIRIRTFVGCDGQGEVQEIGGIGKVGLHRRGEVKLSQICNFHEREGPL